MYKRQSAFSFATAPDALSGSRSRVVAMFADLRGFSNWSETQPLDQVAELVKAQFRRVMDLCGQFEHPFHKFLGDGFVLLWESPSAEELPHCVANAVDATFALHGDYARRARVLGYPAPAGYGVGISVGEAIRIQLEPAEGGVGEVDFVGYPLNCAARMQTLAAGFGTVLCSSTVDIVQSEPNRCLRAQPQGLNGRLLAPAPDMLERAAVTKGLKPLDRTGFRYLSFTGDQDWAWRANGVPQ